MDCSPPGSSVCEISQARILEWIAISSSRGSSQSRIKPTSPAQAGRFLPAEQPGRPPHRSLATRSAPLLLPASTTHRSHLSTYIWAGDSAQEGATVDGVLPSMEELMQKLKLQYSGHLISRVNSLEKTLMPGKTEGRWRRGQQRMRWLDDITDWMDMSMSPLWESDTTERLTLSLSA